METKYKSDAHIISQGVENLVAQLKNDGVLAGKNAADNIIRQAEEEANQILNKAHVDATEIYNQAHEKIKNEKKAAEDALQLAARNMRLELRQQLIARFKEEVKRLIHKELTNEATIRQLILILASETSDKLQQFRNKEIDIQLPDTVLEFDVIRKNPKLLENDPLKILVQGITGQMLKQGIHFSINKENKNDVGFTVRIVAEEIEMDLTEEAISTLLLKHIQPRFRALLEGLLQ
jgi:V/A-type H+-transporting ATPase subunit E